MRVMSFGETIFLFVLALLVFGPKKLPEIARQLGKIMNEFRKASNEFRSQIESEISNIDAEHNRRQILPPSEAPGGAIATLESRPSLAGVTEPKSSDTVVPENSVAETSISEPAVPPSHADEHASRSILETTPEPGTEPGHKLTAESPHELNSMPKAAALPDA
jgi:sec-independent protein translocase protein TatB